jgi:hypothetical protein
MIFLHLSIKPGLDILSGPLRCLWPGRFILLRPVTAFAITGTPAKAFMAKKPESKGLSPKRFYDFPPIPFGRILRCANQPHLVRAALPFSGANSVGAREN